MDEFEMELKRRLRPIPPFGGFTDGVMGRLARQRRGRARRVRAWLAAVVLVAIVFGASLRALHSRRERQEEEARRQFDLAMQLTAATISQAEADIASTGIPFSEVKQ